MSKRTNTGPSTSTSTSTSASTSASPHQPTAPNPFDAGDDQKLHTFAYGHGRMPLFMKLVWLAFIAFCTWYTVEFLLQALARELA